MFTKNRLENEEFRDVWPSNFKLIEKGDLKSFDASQLDALEEYLQAFKENNQQPEPARRGRGFRKTGDKNFDTALKLLTRIKERKAVLEKLRQPADNTTNRTMTNNDAAVDDSMSN